MCRQALILSFLEDLIWCSVLLPPNTMKGEGCQKGANLFVHPTCCPVHDCFLDVSLSYYFCSWFMSKQP